MVNDTIDIHKLNLEELSGVIALYPWYTAARMELCRRLAEAGALSDAQIGQAAMYMNSRSALSALCRKKKEGEVADRDIKEIIKAYLPREDKSLSRPVRAAGGDYFTQAEYDQVRQTDDNIFSTFASKARQEAGYVPEHNAENDFCTETLAKIYLEQNCKEQAINIYSKLILRYPEKRIYFATLIDEINKKEQ